MGLEGEALHLLPAQPRALHLGSWPEQSHHICSGFFLLLQLWGPLPSCQQLQNHIQPGFLL